MALQILKFFQFSAIAAKQPVVEEHPQLPHKSSKVVAKINHIILIFYDYVTVLGTRCVVRFWQAAAFPALIYCSRED